MTELLREDKSKWNAFLDLKEPHVLTLCLPVHYNDPTWFTKIQFLTQFFINSFLPLFISI